MGCGRLDGRCGQIVAKQESLLCVALHADHHAGCPCREKHEGASYDSARFKWLSNGEGLMCNLVSLSGT
eukprot:1321967-Prymnesium_polylepis.1